MNNLAKIGAVVFAFVLFFSMISQCEKRNETRGTSSEKSPQTVESTEVVLREMAKGLDLKAVTELAKTCKTAEDFETRLNAKSEAVNNIDLNKDGKVDYIKVTEYGTGNLRGFSLTTELSPGETQEIATIEFEKDEANPEIAKVQTTGNPSLYGPGYYQHSSFGITDMLLMGWLFSNRPSYASPYGYGYYPPSYGGGWGTQSNTDYARTMSTRTVGSTLTSSSQSVLSKSTPSPNAEKTAARARALTSPTQSQRSFGSSNSSSSRQSGSTSSSSSQSARPNSSSSSSASPVRSGGFGRSSSSGASRSGSSSGGGK